MEARTGKAATTASRASGMDPARLRLARRASQWAFLVLLFAIPISGLFWIDPVDGAFVVLGRQIGFEDILIVFGFWLTVASLLVITYSAAGQVFCGWACPQNTASELANRLTQRLLGRKAQTMDIDGKPMQIARRKRAPWRFVVLFLVLLLAAMLAALVPLIYFIPPEATRAWLLGQTSERLPDSIDWIYAVLVVVMFIDIAFIRHLFCRYMCIYRLWQQLFKVKETLRVVRDEARASDCKTCNYCVESCFLGLDPRNLAEFDSCVNCGECVAACEELHRKSRKLSPPGLLRFAFGAEIPAQQRADARGSFRGRVRAALAAAAAGAVLFALGLAGYQPHRLIVDHASTVGGKMLDYRVQIRHKLYEPARFTIEVEGLPDGAWRLDRNELFLASAGRVETMLHIRPDLPKGLYRIVVIARADDGWEDRYLLRHYAEGGKR